jgi:threonine dehydrogenase-like Zn-dependent dehydrogenase
MKAIVYHGRRDFRFERAPDPKLENELDAIVRVSRTAICGSDLHLWHGGLRGGAPGGFVVGHEFVGTIEEIGGGARRFKRGDRVLASCTVGCGTCAPCRRGGYSGCLTLARAGGGVFGFSPALPGGQAEAVRVPFADTNLFRIPDSLSEEQALFLTDVLPTGYMGAELAAVAPGDTVVVLGCGPVGIFAQLSAQLRGAARVIAVDLDEGRLSHAARLGCETLSAARESVVERVLESTGGLGAEATIEAVGRPELVAQAVAITRHGGNIAVIGALTEPTLTLPWMAIFMKSLTLRTGVVCPQRYVEPLLALIESDRLDPTVVITHRMRLAEAPRGYEIFAGHEENALKVVLMP